MVANLDSPQRQMPSMEQIAELERQACWLSILNESIRELTHLESQDEILKKFLLISLGAAGTSWGFVFKLDNAGQYMNLQVRGLSPEEKQHLKSSGEQIFRVFFQHLNKQEEVIPKQLRMVSLNRHFSVAEDGISWPGGLFMLIQWTMNSGCYGFIGLGPKITREDYTQGEADFMMNLAEVFMDALSQVMAAERVRLLNQDLTLKNQQLAGALARTQKTQLDLDRQVFHFKTLSEMARELSGIFDKKKLLNSFLLIAQGTVSARSGFVMLFDNQEDTYLISRRGNETGSLLSVEQASVKKFVLSFYPSKACFTLPDYKVQPLLKSHMSSLDCDLPLEMGAVFSLDENYFGIMGFSSKITESGFSSEEEELLTSLIRSFLVSLENVLSFEIIQKLNLDLGRRNYELSRTIEELREAREKVNVLQKAGKRITSLIRSELLRFKRVNVLDFVLVFVLTMVLSLTYNLASPGGLSPVPTTWTFSAPPSIETDWAALKHQNESAIFVDARPNEFYSQERIAGALGLPLNLFDFVYMMRFSNLDPQKEIIVYGRNISRRYDEKVAHELMLRGHSNVYILPGGLREWKKLQMPVEP